MGRLTSLPPRAAVLAPRLSRTVDAQGHDETSRSRRLYHLAKWKHPDTGLRVRVFIRDCYTCQWPGCRKIETDTSQLVADHKKKPYGDEDLFFDEDNVWTLCRPHHDSAKQAEEKAGLWG